MNREKSCGAVVFIRREEQLLYVLVQEASGAYSFPKGHMERGETEMQTAAREIREETGLQPVFLDGFRETEEYDMREKPGVRTVPRGRAIGRPGRVIGILISGRLYDKAEGNQSLLLFIQRKRNR